MAQEKNNPEQLIGGLNKDSSFLNQPKSTYRFALNGIRDHWDGEMGNIGNEPGNDTCVSLPVGHILIGHITLDRNSTVLFSLNDDSGDPDFGMCEIGIVEACNYTTIIRTKCLGFNKCNQIKGQFRVRRGCERHIYFNDGLNSDKAINLDNLRFYYFQQYIDFLNSAPLGTPEDPNAYEAGVGQTAWDCNKMKLQPDSIPADIQLVSVNESGGRLEVGMYQFVLRYIDFAGNPTEWQYATQPIPITDDSFGVGYEFFDGAYDIDSRTSADGGVPFTSKSITLDISFLDSRFRSYQLAVVQSRSGNGITKSAYELAEIRPITSSEDTYVFTSIDVTEDIQVDINDITVDDIKYLSSEAMVQVDNRLVRANLKERLRFWADFQREASKIKSKYVVSEEIRRFTSGGQAEDENDNYSSQHPGNYFYRRSYMHDEVYAFGIVYQFEDGSFSPVFHIPGRSINYDCINSQTIDDTSDPNTHNRPAPIATEGWDTTEYDVVSEGGQNNVTTISDAEVAHLGIPGPVDRWKVYNTALQLDTPPAGFVSHGLMAYHECSNATYPTIEDCDGNSIWGDDCEGNPLVNTPIRHHKFPDATLESPWRLEAGLPPTWYVRPLGIEFSNINYPAAYSDEIIGHFIVRVQRTDSTKTVLDKGLMTAPKIDVSPVFSLPKFGYTAQVAQPTNSLAGVWTPETNFKGKFFANSYYKIELLVNTTTTPVDPTPVFTNTTFFTQSIHDITPLQPTTPRTNMTPAECKFIGSPDKEVEGGFVNETVDSIDISRDAYTPQAQLVCSFSNITGLDLQDEFSTLGNVNENGAFVSIKRVADPYCNLETLVYIRTHEHFINSVATPESVIYGGDTFIGRQVSTIERATPVSTSINILMFFTQSVINTELRHNPGDIIDEDYFQADVAEFVAIEDHFDRDGDGSFDRFLEHFGYNDDFSIENVLDIHIPIPSNFNYCTDCQNEYPNRLVYSEVSFSEEVEDNFKSYLVNSFVDIPAHNGSITNIKYDKNQIIVNTEQSMFSIAPNPQALQSDIDTVFLGTGDFLSVPPNEFVKTDYGYAGNQGRFNAINTQHGYVFVDQEDGIVFNFTGQGLQRISDTGMRHWFKENLPSEMNNRFKEVTSEDYPCIDNTASSVGIGLQAVYDPRFQRYILHKTDFDFVDSRDFKGNISIASSDPTTYAIGNIVFDTDENKWYIVGDDVVPFGVNDFVEIPSGLSNTTYFINKSWTISYSFVYQTWSSFHSYQPNYMFNDSENFYTSDYDNDVYVHLHDRNYQKFYNLSFNFIVEYVVKDMATMDLHAVHWYSRTQNWDDNNRQHVDVDSVTFNKLLAYNSCQSTGKLDITYDDETDGVFNIGWDTVTKFVRLTDKNYKVGQLRDLSITTVPQVPVNTSDWGEATYQSEFNLSTSGRQGYIDIVPLPDAINTSALQYEQRDLKDKYHIVRLYFDNPSDYKLMLDIINTVTYHSIR